MIAFTRRLPYILAHNIRTFAKTKSLHRHKNIETLIDHGFLEISHTAVSTTSQLKCRLLNIKNNIRIWLISDSGEERDSIHCSIRVGSGNADDDDKILAGLGHLMEHVIVATNNVMGAGLTMEDYTEIVFHESNQDFGNDLKKVSKFMFCPSIPAMNDTQIADERKQIDAEYHKKRTYSILRHKEQVFKLKVIETMPNFGCGNVDTIPADVNYLRSHLIARRQLYLKRPLFVCCISTLPLDDMENCFAENFWIIANYSTREHERKPREVEPREEEDPSEPLAKKRKREESNLKPSEENSYKDVFVIESGLGSNLLGILFPFNRKFNLREINTLKYIGENLINSHGLRNLEDILLEKRLASNCAGKIESNGFYMLVTLTDCKRVYLEKVVRTVFEYYQAVHDCDWTDMDNYINKLVEDNCERTFARIGDGEDAEFMEFINEKCDGIDEKFDERNFFEMDTGHKAKELIANEILGKKNVIYSIITGEPENVLNVLKGTEKTVVTGTERFFGTRFHTVGTNLYVTSLDTENMVGVCTRSDGILRAYYMNDPQEYVLLIDFSTNNQSIFKPSRETGKNRQSAIRIFMQPPVVVNET